MSVYLTYFVQLLLVIHVLKTGRNRYWIIMLIMLPLIGGVAYLVIEILPEFTGGIRGQRALRQVKKAVNPGAELRQHEAAWQQSPNADNARRYATALLEADKHDEAAKVLDQALSGFFSTEPSLLLLRARLLFDTGNAAGAVDALETLTGENPDFRSPEGHLLYARALEAHGKNEQAINEYRQVAGYFPGVEARYRLASALVKTGHTDDARTELEQLLNDASLAPAHFRKSQKPWLESAKQALKALQA
ncbi:MAG: tetratricopeptide repeat protein [Xanthomonadales bacterium]|nr:tetratricopeptide repeat protein [Gammaproteobacteria bacterium]NNE06378.1 tetratricopeptide repeat protein [Xanthomonadales bacterium]NNL95057.1 tetratricopeptide repeat protein [Xanthomonadales bacterium]